VHGVPEVELHADVHEPPPAPLFPQAPLQQSPFVVHPAPIPPQPPEELPDPPPEELLDPVLHVPLSQVPDVPTLVVQGLPFSFELPCPVSTQIDVPVEQLVWPKSHTFAGVQGVPDVQETQLPLSQTWLAPAPHAVPFG
jgi:hypothetical protein